MSSTGLPSRVAAPLAYTGWWITGAVFLLFERHDAYVRFHAAQAVVAFGAAAVGIAMLWAIAAAALVFMPNAFGFWAWTAAIGWSAGVVLWVTTMWNAATGRVWRIPVAAKFADRLSRI